MENGWTKRIEELEAERDGYRNGQQQLQDTLSTVMDSNAKWANDYKVLEDENRRLREALDLVISFIPDGWSMPLGYSRLVAQIKEASNE